MFNEEINILRKHYEEWRKFYKYVTIAVSRLTQRLPWLRVVDETLKIRPLTTYGGYLHKWSTEMEFKFVRYRGEPLGEFDFRRAIEKRYDKDKVALLLEMSEALGTKWMVIGDYIGLHVGKDIWLTHYFLGASFFVKKDEKR